ncbi:MAG: hypothetical protein DRJ96_00290 [Thermoprotei archaeon]|nr:MAG: hypothetical protein DRJ67_03775 [Thermoprotei archaeon]RLE98705.1 MAG: hypothetical protein DRJ96_00290 [Thermoprotei archaeon]
MLLDLPRLRDFKLRYVSSTHRISSEELEVLRRRIPAEWVEHWRRKGVLRDVEREARIDFYVIEPGQRLELLKLDEPGMIVSMWMTVSGRDRRFLRNLILRAYWDGETNPSVEAPIGDFFLQGHRAFAVEPGLEGHTLTLPLGLSSGGFYCFLPMPFAKARIEVENMGCEEVAAFYYIIGYYTGVELRDMGRLHARWRRERETTPGKPYLVLRARGRGHYVGTYLYMRGLSLKKAIVGGLGFLEGNVRIVADGEVAYCATGTEDYFLSGWYFMGGAFNAPFHGLVYKDERRGEVAAYRFHVPDPVPFREWIEVTAPHGEWNEVAADYSSVAYWYQLEPHEEFYRLRREDLY